MTRLKITLILSILLFTLFLYKKAVSKKYSIESVIPWFGVVVFLMIVVALDKYLKPIANAFGVEEVVNFVFFLCFGVIISKIFVMSTELSKQKNQISKLTQEISILQATLDKTTVREGSKK